MPQMIKTQNQAQPVAPATSKNKTTIMALMAIIMSMLLTALDQTIVNPAMPRIVEELQGFSLFAWVSTAYLLTSTAMIPIAGKLGDIFGRKPLLIIAVIVFLLGSFLSGAAPSMIWLVIFRAIQGIGAGALQANVFTSIAELFPDPARRARWQGVVAAVFGLSAVIGPALGGFITDNLAWRWVFYVNVPVGFVAILALILYLPYQKGGGERKIDWWGATTITGAVVSLLLALSWGGQAAPKGYAWISPQILGLLATFAALTGVFIWIEKRTVEPIIPLHLFKIAAVRSVAAISFGLGVVMLGALYFIPLFVQVVLGQSASTSGAVTTPLAVALVITNILTGQFISRVGLLKLPMVAGAIITTLGVGLLTLLNAASQPWEVTLFMIVIGIGLGLIMPVTTIAVQESVQRQDLGAGISSVQFFRSIGSTIGVAVIGTVVNTTYLAGINNAPGVTALPAGLLSAIQEPQNLLNPQIAARLPQDIILTVRTALTGAINGGYLLALAVSVLALLVTMMMPSLRIKTISRTKTSQIKAGATPPQEAFTASPSGD